jgi:hypothetical protein
MRRLPPLRCTLVLAAGLCAWAVLAGSRPAGGVWVVAWVFAPLLVIGLLVAGLAALRLREPGDVVQLPGAVGVGLLNVSAWGWVVGHLVLVGSVLAIAILVVALGVALEAWHDHHRTWLAAA